MILGFMAFDASRASIIEEEELETEVEGTKEGVEGSEAEGSETEAPPKE